MDVDTSVIIKNLSEALLAIVSIICKVVQTVRKKPSEKAED